jgi:radical SAM enzyme (TIGR01210 family)
MLMISELMEKPLASWRGQERYGNELLDCLTIIFKSGGCSWSKCRMCGYRHERYSGSQSPETILEHLRAQLSWVSHQYKTEEYRMVKIFTSGVFLTRRRSRQNFFLRLQQRSAGNWLSLKPARNLLIRIS